MLKEIYSSYVQDASLLGDYQSMSKTDLANGYYDSIDNNDVNKAQHYFSALVLRYWYKIYEWGNTSRSTRLGLEDYYSWLVEAISLSLGVCNLGINKTKNAKSKIREWDNPKSSLYKDINGPDKLINRALFSVRNYYYQKFNKDKRKINYLCYSIDEQEEDFGDGNVDTIKSASYNDNYLVNNIIDLLLIKGKIIEAIIIDSISYQDSFKVYKNGQDYYNKTKLIKTLKNMNDNYINYFINTYNVIDKNQTILKMNELKQSKNQKLYNYVENTLKYIKEEKNISESLCL